MLTSFWTARATCTCGGRGGGDCFWPQPAHKSEPKRLNRRTLPIRNTIRDPFMPFFSLAWIFLEALGLMPITPKPKTCLHCVRHLQMLRFTRLRLMAGIYDVLRICAVARVVVDWDVLFAATISVETFQRCFARLLSFRSGLPTAIWQSDQYSPVIPET